MLFGYVQFINRLMMIMDMISRDYEDIMDEFGTMADMDELD